MKKKLYSMITAFACCALLLSGCAAGTPAQTSAAEGTKSEPQASSEDNSWQKVKDSGKFILGLDATFVPMGYTDENDKIVGFDIDVAQAVCDKLEISLTLEPINWDTKEEDLELGKIDCIWNGLSYSDSRAEVMTLSMPYMVNDMIFVVNDSSVYQSADELSGKNIAVQNGSTAQEILEGSDIGKNSTVTAIATNIEALQQMELGLVDGVFVDSVVANYLITSTGKSYRVLPETVGEEEQYVIGFRKSDKALCAQIEDTLRELKTDGTIAGISEKWFGSDITTIK